MDGDTQAQEYGPWNPGLRSPVPSSVRPLSTLLRAENVLTSLSTADELASFTGLRAEEIVLIRPERLVVHELLIRVTADISVPDGSEYEDLGINFREIVGRILKQYIDPHMPDIVAAYEEMTERLTARLDAELSARLFAVDEPGGDKSAVGFLARILPRGKPTVATVDQPDGLTREMKVIHDWREKLEAAEELETRAVYRSLLSVVTGIQGIHGRIRGDKSLITSLAANLSCNRYGSRLIGDLIDPLIIGAVEGEGYRLLPVQPKPIVMNTKGASASGKSTLRPLQKELARKLNVDWTDFALISPDIWRKYLLAYDSLGDDYKYAGALTSDEVALIDQKLDAYMARKAEDGRMSHLLIDRFRFDSFAPVSDEAAGSTLLTRFGHEVYMFFMITPPEETVERAWKRGEDVGRYKTVDDLLFHNVEAFTGMPRLFFTWALKTDKAVHYEFLDNDVPMGERPRTVAFGVNGDMTILDVGKMLDVERYRKVNINGLSPAEVYPDPAKLSADQNAGFLQECAKLIPSITFADQANGRIYGVMKEGEVTWTDEEILSSVMRESDAQAGLAVLAGELSGGANVAPQVLKAGDFPTLGQWGEESQSPESA